MFWDKEKQDAEIAKNHIAIVDSMANRKVLWRMFSIGLLANVLIWLAVLLIPETVYKVFYWVGVVSDKLSKALLGIPLFTTAFTVYALFRFKFPNLEEQKLDSEMMASFAYQSNSNRRFWIWVGSLAIGVANTGLLILIDLYLQ